MVSHRGSPALRALFPSKARRAVLAELFPRRDAYASVSELARRAGLTPRAVSVEVEKLEAAGLVEVEAMGPAHVVRANARHPVARALAALLEAAAAGASDPDAPDRAVRQSLTAHGAPLIGEDARAVWSLPETLLHGLKLARRDATVLRVLPVVVAKHARALDWADLRERARRMNLKSELGMLLELTGDVAGIASLREKASELADARRTRERYFPAVASRYERRLAETRTPPAARRWGFRMNMTEEAFRAIVAKHVPA